MASSILDSIIVPESEAARAPAPLSTSPTSQGQKPSILDSIIQSDHDAGGKKTPSLDSIIQPLTKEEETPITDVSYHDLKNPSPDQSAAYQQIVDSSANDKSFDPNQYFAQDLENANKADFATDVLMARKKISDEEPFLDKAGDAIQEIPAAAVKAPLELGKAALHTGENFLLETGVHFGQNLLKAAGAVTGTDLDLSPHQKAVMQTASQEVGKGIATGVLDARDVGRKIVRLGFDQQGTPVTREEMKRRLIEDATLLNAKNRLGTETLKTPFTYSELSPQEMAAQGEKPNPEGVAQVASITNPINIGMGMGMAGKLSAGILPAAEAAGVPEMMAAPVKGLAGLGLQASGKLVQLGQKVGTIPVIGKIARGAVGAVASTATGLGHIPIIGGVVKGGIAAAADDPYLFSGLGHGGASFGTKAARTIFDNPTLADSLINTGKEWTSAFGKNLEDAPIPVVQGPQGPSLVSRVGKFFKPELAGAAGALAFSAPLLFASQSPEELGRNIGGAIGIGAAGGGTERLNAASPYYVPTALADAYFSSKNPQLQGSLSTEYKPYGSDPTLDALHEKTMATLSPEDNNNVNRVRDLFGGTVETYVLPRNEFLQRSGSDGHGYFVEPGEKGQPARMFLNEDTVALQHEPGHAIENIIQSSDPAAWESISNWILKNKSDELASFGDYYQKLRAKDSKGVIVPPLTPQELVSEYFAEQTQLAMQGKPLSELGTEDPLWKKIASATGRALERSGIAPNGQRSILGVKPSFVTEKFINDFLDLQAKNAAAGKVSSPEGETPTQNPANAPASETSTRDPYDVVLGVRQKLHEQEAAQLAADKKTLGKRNITVPQNNYDLPKFISAAHDAGQLIQTGQLKGPQEAEIYLEGVLHGSPTWSGLSQEEKSSVADLAVNAPKSIFDFFSHNPDQASPTFNDLSAQQKKIEVELGAGTPAPNQGLKNVKAEEVAPPAPPVPPTETTKPESEAIKPYNNIRVDDGITPRADKEPFTQETAIQRQFTQKGQDPGMREATKRQVTKSGDIENVPTTLKPGAHLTGPGLNTENPDEAAIFNKVVRDSAFPKVASSVLGIAKDAIKEGKNMSVGYLSGKSDVAGSPTNLERKQAVKEADLGFTGRTPVQKTIAPVAIDIRKTLEPSFTPTSIQNAKDRALDYFQRARRSKAYKPPFKSLEEAVKAIDIIGRRRAANQPLEPDSFTLKQSQWVHENMFDQKPVMRAYLRGYSQDKVIANAKNLSDSLEDSDLLKDPEMKRGFIYLRSGEFQKDWYARNSNMAQGYRGDGQIFKGMNGEDVNAGWRNPTYTPVPIPDWKIQVLNALEGGTSKTFYKEAQQNLPGTGRPQAEDIINESPNPFQRKLESLGDKLLLARGKEPVSGFDNIVAPAQETLRVDRVIAHLGNSDITLPASSYGQQSAGFMPTTPEEQTMRQHAETPEVFDQMSRPAPAKHIGDMEFGNKRLPLFNLTEPVGDHPVNSTVSSDSLKRYGFDRPEGYDGQFMPKFDKHDPETWGIQDPKVLNELNSAMSDMETGRDPKEPGDWATFTDPVIRKIGKQAEHLFVSSHDESYNDFVDKNYDAVQERFKAMREQLAQKRMEAKSGGGQFMPRTEGGFYSDLEDKLSAKMPARASVDQIRGIIKDAKPEEVKWSGIEDLLSKDKGPLTKEEVLNHIAENSPKFEETTLSNAQIGSKTPDQWLEESENHDRIAQRLQRSGNSVEANRHFEMAEQANRNAEGINPETGSASGVPKYSKYQIQGGENYREVVLTMPGKDDYKSSHFQDVPNYVAHMRLNDRMDSNGKPGTFIEELQSDRHQEGREKGYIYENTPSTKGWSIESKTPVGNKNSGSTQYAIRTPDGLFSRMDVSGLSDETVINRAANDYQKANNPNAVPDAPFRKTWPVQMFKRALRDAVSSGKEWIGWTTGDTQAERYDLSKQVDDIRVRKRNNGTYSVFVTKKGESGQMILSEEATDKDLPDMVGKELAQKISQQEAGPVKKYSGGDLKVGGEGMKGFYDQILPKEIGAYVKKMGGKVEQSDLAIPEKDGTVQKPIWRVDITPEMKEKVGSGQPLFMPKGEHPLHLKANAEGTIMLAMDGIRGMLTEETFPSYADWVKMTFSEPLKKEDVPHAQALYNDMREIAGLKPH